jgi:hypothetical protein
MLQFFLCAVHVAIFAEFFRLFRALLHLYFEQLQYVVIGASTNHHLRPLAFDASSGESAFNSSIAVSHEIVQYSFRVAFVSELGFSFVAQRLKRRLDVVVPEFCKALRRHPTRDVAIAARVFKARNV